MKTRRRIASILLAAIIVVSGIPSMVFAVDETSVGNPDVSGSKSASPTELTSKQRETEVTLSMPSAEAREEYDVVFAMDSSSSTKNIHFSEYVKDFLGELAAKDAVIRVGVIKARGRAFDTIKLASNKQYSGLVEYSADTEAAILAGVNFKEDDLKALSSGSNMHGALDMANDMLEDDSSIPNDHKFVILLMDGKTYIWNNDNDEPTSYYTQYMGSKGTIYAVPTVGQATGAYSKAAWKHGDKYYYKNVKPNLTDLSKCFYYEDFAELYASGNEELGKTDTKYDHYCAYADNKGSAAGGYSVPHTVTNGSQFTYNIHKNYYEYFPTDEWADLNYLEAAPYEIIKEGEIYTYDLEKPNPDFYQVHPDCLQKGLYLTAKMWEEMNEKYTTGAIIYSGWPPGSGLAIAKSFDTWIKGKDISDYAAEITEADQVKAMFNSIKEDIIYMVASGTVTDKIPQEFSLVKNGNDTFKLTVAGESLKAAADGSNAWNFDTANDQGVYPYRVEYDEAANSFKWIINVPIENAKKLELKYKLAIDEDAAEGLHDTNVSAVLDYVTSKGETGTYEFKKPQVNYKLDKDYTLTINYVYANGRTAATSYRSTLKAGASYGPINSPAINGYRADRASVSGVMPEGDVTYTVVYTRTGGGNPPNNPGGGDGPVVTPDDEQTTPPTIPDEPTPTTEPPATVIVDPEPPLAAGAWALINLICAILTAIGAIIALFRRKEEEDEDEDEAQNAYKAEDEEEEDDNRGKKMLAAKAAGVLAGVAAPITFFLTEDMSLPMQLIDKWTLLMVVILAVQIVAAVFNKKASELDDDEEEVAEEAAN